MVFILAKITSTPNINKDNAVPNTDNANNGVMSPNFTRSANNAALQGGGRSLRFDTKRLAKPTSVIQLPLDRRYSNHCPRFVVVTHATDYKQKTNENTDIRHHSVDILSIL